MSVQVKKKVVNYLVFVELERCPELPDQIIKIMEDSMNLTEQKLEDWRVRYHKSTRDHELTLESLKELIPLTPEEYDRKYDKEQEELDQMKAIAGVPVTTKAPKNEYTESLRIAAGIKI